MGQRLEEAFGASYVVVACLVIWAAFIWGLITLV